MTGLRERRHVETKQAIVEAAFALFDEHGFSGTIMEHIAADAGVSRSTLYRRYSNKEEIVLEVPRSWLAVWDRAIEALPPDASAHAVVTTGCYAVADEIDSTSERVLAAFAALAESPTLQTSSAANTDWLNRVADVVESRSTDVDSFDAMVIAGACMGAIDAMMAGWAAAGGATSVRDATDRVVERIGPILGS